MTGSSLLLAICMILGSIQLDNDTLTYIGLGFAFFTWAWNTIIAWALVKDAHDRPWRYW